MPAFRFAFLLAAALFLAAAPCALAQEDDMNLPFVGEYELQAEGNTGEMSIRFEDDQFFHVAVFTTSDEAMHFCDYSGRFVQEEAVLVEYDSQSDQLPLIIYNRGGYLEIDTDPMGACGLNQTMVGQYHPVAE